MAHAPKKRRRSKPSPADKRIRDLEERLFRTEQALAFARRDLSHAESELNSYHEDLADLTARFIEQGRALARLKRVLFATPTPEGVSTRAHPC